MNQNYFLLLKLPNSFSAKQSQQHHPPFYVFSLHNILFHITYRQNSSHTPSLSRTHSHTEEVALSAYTVSEMQHCQKAIKDAII